MYRTKNIHILLKLDTATGKVWMVQYGTGDTKRMVVPLDDTSLLAKGEEEVPGRYKMYSTKNTYNFILLDTKEGDTYQVQWHIEEDKRIRVKIENPTSEPTPASDSK
jgi:hypothetical protein